MRKKLGLTPERHTEIGMLLAVTRDELTGIYVEVANAYPTGEAYARKLERAVRLLDEARCRAENLFCAENREAFTMEAYYPSPETRRRSAGT